MPRAYVSNPAIGQGLANLAELLVGNPLQEVQAGLMGDQRMSEQERRRLLAGQARAEELANEQTLRFQDSIDPTAAAVAALLPQDSPEAATAAFEQIAASGLAAGGNADQITKALLAGINQGQALYGNDTQVLRSLGAQGKLPDQNTAVSVAGQDRIAERDALADLAVQQLRNEGAIDRQLVANERPQALVGVGPDGQPLSLRVPKKVAETEAGQVNVLDEGVRSLTGLLGQVNQTPGAVGIRGAIAGNDDLGKLRQLPGVGGLVGSAMEAIGGASVAEVRKVRNNARAVVAPQIKVITGEQSGRYTEAERQLANQVLGVLDAANSYEDVQNAILTVLELNTIGAARARHTAGLPPLFDPNDEDSTLAFAKDLLDQGVTRDQARKIMKSLEKVTLGTDPWLVQRGGGQ